MRIRTTQPQGLVPIDTAFNCVDPLVFIPGVTPCAFGNTRIVIPQPRAIINTSFGLAITSSHLEYFKGLAKTASTGTFVILHKPDQYWGTYAFCLETLYSYQTIGMNFYAGQWNFMIGNNRYPITAFSGDQTNHFHTVAISHNGAEYRSAWSGAGQRGFTITAGTEWLNDGYWNANYDIISLNASYTSGSAQGAGGILILAVYLPNIILSDSCLMTIRDNPWQLFPHERKSLLFTSMGSGSYTPITVSEPSSPVPDKSGILIPGNF